ncbi:hypothetical protein OG225_31425 [Nocardia sp. NBC_01377]|uniref:hypothetical protein n=1 Tax=Nocardia sp. NBC_01377 TaxID=2903595 RepID=UPI00324F624C
MTFEYEKSKIAAQSATDNASSQSHIVLKNTFDPLVTDPAAESKADYAKIAEGWEYSVQIFAARIKRSSESAWSGTAATTAQQSISDYATDALNLTPALRELSTRVDEALTAVINTKRDIVPYSDDPQSWWNPGDWFDGNPEADAEELARKVVQEKYINPIAQTDHSIPVLPIPKDPTNPSGDPGGTPGSGTPSTGSPSTGSPTTGTPTGTTPAAANPNSNDPSTNPQSSGNTPSSNNPTTGTPTTGTPTGTNPAGTNPAATNVPTTNVPKTNSPTGTPRTGTPGSGSPGSGSPSGTSPGAGRSVTGTPTSKGTSGGSGGSSGKSTGTSSGRNGTPGMGGMGNRGGKGDDDDEHKIPDYLIQDRETELLGVQPRVLPPGGVIGG